jgi:uncharacterized protein YceH (UPF0502 family)
MTQPPFADTPLTAIEARVLGTLMEKARTVPDSYPLTLNSLQTGCNQKSARDPVMNLGEHDIAEALDGLRRRALVLETQGGRTTRYEHNAQRGLGVPEQAAVLLGMLMLRGPQTAGELRLNTERWYRFLDIASVEAFLEELQERTDDKGGPMVVKLTRQPGARESRWAHLLCGPVDAGMLASDPGEPGTDHLTALQSLWTRVDALETRVQELEARLARAGGQIPSAAPELSPPGQAGIERAC